MMSVETSHRAECLSYASFRAETTHWQREGWTLPAERVEILALELLSAGDVSCICAEIPSGD